MTDRARTFVKTAGLVATTPQVIETTDGLWVATFRLASPTTTINRSTNEVVVSTTNWFTVSVFGEPARKVGEKLMKGDRIIVHGDLKIRDWDNGERYGTAVEIDSEFLDFDPAFEEGRKMVRSILNG